MKQSRTLRRLLSLALSLCMVTSLLPAATLAAGGGDVSVTASVPQGNKIVLGGLFDVKSLHAGDTKYLYVNTHPQEGITVTAQSDAPGVVAVSMVEDNGIKLEAKAKGEATVTVTAHDDTGVITQDTVETFTVQVIDAEYAGTQRVETLFNDGWQFKLERDMASAPASGTVPAVDDSWEDVTIPHCWNAQDGADGGNNYHKGIGWYVKEFTFDSAAYAGKTIYLEFDGACKVSELYVNGQKVGRHEGGYSIFRYDITSYVTLDQPATIALSVDNRVNSLTPMSGDFTVFGGLYRDVTVIATGDVHMDLETYGSSGLYLSQQGAENVTKDTTVADVFGEGGKLTVKGQVKNSGEAAQTVSAVATVYDADWQQVAAHTFDAVEIPAGETHAFSQQLVVSDPHLWNGTKDPYLYNVVFEVKDQGGAVVDREQDRFGFRFFCADPEEGFFLNGESYPLRGVNSHQDRYDMGYAVPHQYREQDMAMMDEIGANTIRFAHYQHDPFVYELAEERGITVWAEIPMVNSIVNTRDFYNSTITNLKELIHQAYNRASVVVWGIHNEQWPNNAGINVLLNELYNTAKAEDPSRYVTVATAQPAGDTATGDQMGIGLSWQSDVSAWNKYFGLYQGKDVRYFGTWINDVHTYGLQHKTVTGTDNGLTNPEGEKEQIDIYVHGNIGMSEYGVGSNPAYHEEQPGYSVGTSASAFQTEEFQAQWHEIYYKAIDESPWMWGSYIWNMFEFGSDGRNEAGRQGINNKGMVSYDREYKKDVFYFYQANWSDDPMIHLNSKTFTTRHQDDISVKVYSNLTEVELFVNGVSQGKLTPDSNSEPALNNSGEPDDTLIPNTQLGKFVWDVTLQQGENSVVVVGKDAQGNLYTDSAVWNRALYDEPGVSSSRYSISDADPDNRTISKVPGGTTVETLLANLTPLRNSTIEVQTAEGVKIEDPSTVVELGMKVKVTAEDGQSFYLYTIVSSPVSEGKAVTASAVEKDSTAAKYAVDGDTATRWSTPWPGTYPQWIYVDLGQPYTIGELRSLWYNNTDRSYQFRYEVSLDGETFTPITDSITSPRSAWDMTVPQEDAVARYVRIYATGSDAANASASVYEFQVFGFALQSTVYGVNNVARTIAGVDETVTVPQLLSSLTADGSYNSISVMKDGAPVTEGSVTSDMTVVVSYGEDKTAEYTLAMSGSTPIPVSQGKSATALDVTFGDATFPNQDAGDGCGKGEGSKDSDVAANINDGDLSTRWTGALPEGNHSGPIFPAEVVIDLGAEYQLNQVDLTFFNSSTARYYKFALYAGSSSDPDALRTDANMVWDMRNNDGVNSQFVSGGKDLSASARYILLSVTGSSTGSAYHAASVYELSVYGYRFTGSDYQVDTQAHTVSGVAEQTKVAAFLSALGLQGNYTAEVLLDGQVLDSEDTVTPGAQLRISTLDSAAPVVYAIETVSDSGTPISQGMPVHVNDATFGDETKPNEDVHDSHNDKASNINDGDLSTRWTGALDSSHTSCYYPGIISVDLTDMSDSEDWYYLTGVEIYWYGAGNRSYQYKISAKNPVGIETGYEADASDNQDQSGKTEHWVTGKDNQIKDLTLNVLSCSNTASYASPSAFELKVYGWRILGTDFPVDELSASINIGEAAVTVAQLRNSLDVKGNCTVAFVDAQGQALSYSDTLTGGCKMIVTDVKDQTFEYAIQSGSEPEKVPVTGVTLSKSELTLMEEASEALTATVTPEDATNKAVTWSSDNTAVATVDGNGVVTAVAAGSATITVTTVDGEFTATCVVTVTEKPAESWTVTFLSNGQVYKTDYVAKEPAAPVAEPTAPVEEGYYFDGWYTDEAFTTAYDFTQNVTGDLTLYAKWIFITPSYERYAITLEESENGSVAASARYSREGNTITLTVKADEGYVLDTLTVTAANGDEVKLTEKSENKYTFQMPESKVSVKATFVKEGEEPAEDFFTDVAEDAWYYDAVVYAVDKGFMAGVTEDTFAPDAQLTRAQLAQMLYALEGAPEVTGESAFTDVAESAWYAKAVTWAVENKLVSGYGDGTFGPDDALTREQLTAILYAYAKGEGAEMDGKADLSKFTDIDTLSAWAETSMAWAVDAGLVGGMEDGTLAPAGTATRAQMAQIMMNLLEKVL